MKRYRIWFERETKYGIAKMVWVNGGFGYTKKEAEEKVKQLVSNEKNFNVRMEEMK